MSSNKVFRGSLLYLQKNGIRHVSNPNLKPSTTNKVIYSRYRLNPYKESTDEFYLLVNGTLFVPYGSPYLLGTKDYCMETFWNESYPAGLTLPLVCFQQQEEKKSSSTTLILYATGKYLMKSLFSLLFLLLPRKYSRSVKIQVQILLLHGRYRLF